MLRNALPRETKQCLHLSSLRISNFCIISQKFKLRPRCQSRDPLHCRVLFFGHRLDTDYTQTPRIPSTSFDIQHTETRWLNLNQAEQQKALQERFLRRKKGKSLLVGTC